MYYLAEVTEEDGDLVEEKEFNLLCDLSLFAEGQNRNGRKVTVYEAIEEVDGKVLKRKHSTYRATEWGKTREDDPCDNWEKNVGRL